ncbi:DUF1566 domain-containing protein [Vibrio kyushuensis]|uniref:Lcl C-terminal domain-containing protein n=1 Tax=Vibrio kyushuensis TaxID=2910249 RepID=UPI003D126987
MTIDHRMTPIKLALTLASTVGVLLSASSFASTLTTPIVDTNQTQCFSNKNSSSCSSNVGQDAQYQGNLPNYTNNGNGTVSDNVTRLMWTQSTDLDNNGKITVDDKLGYEDALEYVKSIRTGGYNDWRLPTIKELHSLVLFDGQDPSGLKPSGEVSLVPFIDARYFVINAGDTDSGERLIDSQFVSSTKYVSTTMNKDETVFGVNFIDGRIKGYGIEHPRGGKKTFYVLAVRGNTDYGVNQFSDNRNGTIMDSATTLVWQQSDSQNQMDFPKALSYCESLSIAGRDDWRLPNVKELQSIVDYSRSPATTDSPSIDPIFSSTSIKSEGNQNDYANYWSSTTHINLRNGANASYVSFGRSMGYMNGKWMDVHGAGAQRSDPKVGDAGDYPTGHGPQGDSIRIDNMVRCVTGGSVQFVEQPDLIPRPAMTFKNSASSSASSSGSQGVSNKQPMRQGSGKSGNGHFEKMDRNGDGKLSKNEVKGPLANDFKRLDNNSDGYISKDEMPKR